MTCQGDTHVFSSDGSPVHLTEGDRALCVCGRTEVVLEDGRVDHHMVSSAVEFLGRARATYPGFCGLL